jgi:outer membrane receptor protein involved in Fe transport
VKSGMRSSLIIVAFALFIGRGLPAQESTTAIVPAPAGTGDLDEIVVNGIRRGDLILPTTVTSTSAYGLDLGVMDTPRNNTLLSKVQLDALNIQNPGGFSYLTSSSYTDSSFGAPAVPRLRGQFADLYWNGMRESFSGSGYGAPVSFNSADSIDVIKGPASVQEGPGAGVGGSVNIITKIPSLAKPSEAFTLELDSQQKRIASVDVNMPLNSDTAARVSFTTNDSGSYYRDMFFYQQSLYAAVLTELTPRFSVLVTGSYEDSRYRENDGINRVNQALIDNGTYLTGTTIGPIQGLGSTVDLTGTAQLNNRIVIDETNGTAARAQHFKGQIIQTFKASDDFSIVNNTFYDYMNRYNQTMYYFADTCKACYTLENKTDFKLKLTSGSIEHDLDAGFTYRYAHWDVILDVANEPVLPYDLTQNPSSWVFPADLQITGDAIPYTAAFGRQQYGVPDRDPFISNGSVDSNLQDAAIFLEHRMHFSPRLSVLYGLRADMVQLDYSDPFGGAVVNGFAKNASTAWYGLYNGNVSVVYSPSSHVSAYLTYNKAQYVLSNATDGAISLYGLEPTTQLRQNTLLEEAGLKFDLLDKALFLSTAIFNQDRAISSGRGGLQHSLAHIKGAEIELNYQPDPHFFATASYSYLHTVLDTPQTFYNFPAMPGVNFDGGGLSAVWQPNQTFLDPGVPQHLFNVLVNYKLNSGLGFQSNLQVTGPIEVSQSGWLNVAATAAGFPGISNALVTALDETGGYFRSPTIPWQYTLNTAAFYNFRDRYSIRLEVYNLTDRRNLANGNPFFGNDFLTVAPSRSYDLTLSARF